MNRSAVWMKTLFACAAAIMVFVSSVFAQTTVSAGEEDLTPFGLKLTPPSAWTRLEDYRPESVATWAVRKAANATAATTVSIEIQSAKSRSAKVYAAELADRFHGSSADGGELNTERAWRVSAAGT